MTYIELDVTPDTPEWYEVRRGGLGASDSAAILNLSKWSTPLDVYRSKKGVERDFDPMVSWIGHAQEPVIEKWITDFHPEVGRLRAGFAAQSREWSWLFATPDRLVDDMGILIPVELKTSMEFARDAWTDEIGRPRVPLYYQVQVQQQIAVLDAPYGWLAVFHGGRDFELYRVERDEEFIREHLVPQTRDFWWHHVLADLPPEPSTIAELYEVYPSEKGTEVEGSETVVEAAERRAVLLSDIQAQKDEADALTLAIGLYMGSAETLTYGGQPLLTYRTQSGRRTVDLNVLEADFPQIAAQVIKQGDPFKVMRMSKRRDPK